MQNRGVRRLTLLLDEHPSAPEAPIAYAGGEITTRGALDELVDGLRRAFERAGFAGRRVGVMLPNEPATIATWFALWRVGATVVPLNPRVPASEIARLASAASASAVVTRAELVERLPAADVRFDAPLVGAVLRDADVVDDDDPAALMQFTSGTTGRPKAVPLRHERVLAMLDPVIASLRGKPSAARAPMPNLIPVSLSLWAGIYNVLFAFRVGAPVVLMDRFVPDEFARLVSEFGIRSSVLPPAALVMLVDDERVTSLEPLAYVRSVSAPLSPYQARRFHERFGVAVLNGYGQTELGGEVVGWSAADWREHGAAKLGAVGRPHAGIELRVRDESGAVVPAGELGELEIRTAAGPPPESEGLADRITEDGWLRTGDLARVDADGFVWIEGRVSAMINRGGLKVFPDEVEEVLRSHPSVIDAGVVGVPDARLGEVPVAYVVPATAPAELDVDELQQWCRDRLAPYKVPVGIEPIDRLPRNEIGKLLRNELVARWTARAAANRS